MVPRLTNTKEKSVSYLGCAPIHLCRVVHARLCIDSFVSLTASDSSAVRLFGSRSKHLQHEDDDRRNSDTGHRYTKQRACWHALQKAWRDALETGVEMTDS